MINGIARQLREAADALHDMAEVLDPTGPTEMSQYAKAAYDEATDLAYRNGFRDGQKETSEALSAAYERRWNSANAERDRVATEALAAEFKRGWDKAAQVNRARRAAPWLVRNHCDACQEDQ